METPNVVASDPLDLAFPPTCEKCVFYRSILAPKQHSHSQVTTAMKYIDEWYKHSAIHFKKQKHGNGAPTGAFAFTLTKSPTEALTIGDMLTAVRKIVSQKSCPVVRYAWYYEDKGRDENGDAIHPHIHGMYETATGGRIERKHFRRAWPIWGEGDDKKRLGAGFVGGYHRPVRSEEAYSDYIKKDGGMGESFGLADEKTE